MKKPKRSFLWAGITLIIFTWSGLFAQPELNNIRKGGKDKKAWVVLSFSEKTRIGGISHPDMNTLAVYLYGKAGNFNGQLQQIHNGRSIRIQQASDKPPYSKIILTFEDSASIVVVERQNNVIVSFSDDKLLQEALNLPIQLNKDYMSGFLKDVQRDAEEKQEKVLLSFEGNYQLNGFILYNNSRFSLLVTGASVFTASDLFTYPNSNVSKVTLNSTLVADSSFCAEFDLSGKIPFAVTAKKDFITVLTKSSVEDRKSGDFSKGWEEVAVSSKEKTLPAITAENQVPDKNNPGDVSNVKSVVNSQDQKPAKKQQQTTARKPGIPWDMKVSFRFNDTPIKDALRIIARAAGLNMVVGEGVEGKVTMNLENVSLRQTLNKIVHTHDCDYLVDKGIITVKPTNIAYSGGRITKVYYLKYADANNILPIVKQIVSADSLVHVFHREFLFFDEAGKNRMKKNEVAIQGIRRASMFVVTDRPEVIRQIDSVIEEIDKEPVQFVIRAKLIETAPSTNNQLGINWDKTLTTALQWQELLPNGDASTYSMLNSNIKDGDSWKMGHLSASEYKAVLDFLREKTDSKIISNPSVVAMDNEESVMSAGQTVPVPKIQRGLGGQGDMVTFDYKEVNIQLNVTPHLSENDIISMYVNPVIEEITGWVELDKNRAPITSKRTVNSIVTVRSGETVVIGGLMKNQRERTTSKVWLLGSIPLIGNLFRHETYTDKRTELLIFITPEIVRSR